MKIDMTGRWEGEYQYGDEYTPRPEPVRFHMDLRAGWFGSFQGTVQDDATSGMPELGRIRGSIDGSNIVFAKLMPVAYGFDAGRKTIFRDHLRAKTGRDPGPIPHPELKYDGTYDPESLTFRGHWRLAPPSPGSGAWWMTKARS